MTTSRVEIRLAKLYVFLLPFRMITPFLFLEDVLGPMAVYVDFILHVLGMSVWFKNEGGFFVSTENRLLFNRVKYSILYLNLSSFIMAFVMLAIFGYCNGVSPFRGILAQELFYFQYIFIFLYNIRVFTILEYNDLVSVIKKTSRVLLGLAYIQIAVMNGIGGAIYDAVVNIVGGFNTSSMLPKLCLTCSEGASAGSLLGMFVIPFILARIIHGDKSAKYEFLLWLLPIYYTRSSTAIILFLIDCLLFLYLMFKKSLQSKRLIRNLIGGACIICILIVVVSLSGGLSGEFFEEINYLLFEKAADQNNGSTIARSVPLIINWGCFTEMPIWGVGNGLQGYFFNKYFPYEYLYVEGSDIGEFYDIAQTGIANGGSFLPGYFSGYGIIGLIVLIGLIVGFIRQRKVRRHNMGVFNEMFIMGAVAFFPCGMQGELYATYYAWFVISLPFMYYFLPMENSLQR